MKIGILTFHRAHNYGAQLQAYALAKKLSDMGHEAEFVDYRQPNVEKAYKLFRFDTLAGASLINKSKILLSQLMMLQRKRQRKSNFDKFSNDWIQTSEEYSPLHKFKTSYDALIFGSDQIWTTRFLGDFDSILWGDVDIKANRKISYAPSMEMRTLSKEQSEFCKSHLSNFDSISVRENNMRDLLGPLTNKDMEVVVDPTFLIDKEEYARLASKSRLDLPNRYILLYSVGKPSENVKKIAYKVSSQLQIPLRIICGEVGLKSSVENLDTAGPYDFLKAFHHAEFVVTTTFHGTAFSVINEKRFYSIKQAGVSGRAESLLENIGLKDKMISVAEDVDANNYGLIDYVDVEKRLDLLRNKSFEFLKRSLS